jgi:cyanate permease
VPLAAVLGGWRGALIALSASACVLAVAWAVLERGADPHVRPPALVPRLPWRSGTAWLLVAIFGAMASGY